MVSCSATWCPHASFIPGRVEDIVFIVIATRAFVYSCPEALVNRVRAARP